jgi:hypothetical protein
MKERLVIIFLIMGHFQGIVLSQTKKSGKGLTEVFPKTSKAIVRIDVGQEPRTGTGVVIGVSEERLCYVLTAYHVVEEVIAKGFSVEISFIDAVQPSKAIVIDKQDKKYYDAIADLAVLVTKAPMSRQEVITFGIKSGKQGLRVATIGHPLGEPWKFSEGIITNITGQYLISDVPVQSGSSGGPLLDDKGRTLGLIPFFNEELRKTVTKKEQETWAYSSELIIPTLEAWLGKTKFAKKWKVEKHQGFFIKALTHWKWDLHTIAKAGTTAGAGYLIYWWRTHEHDLPGPPAPPASKN